MQARYPTRIKSHQLATFYWSAPPASGTSTQDQTINPVDLSKTILRPLTPGGLYIGNQSTWLSFFLSSWFLSATSVRGQVYVHANYTGQTAPGVYFQVEVIEFWEKPKSLQVVQGNGSTTQTINSVDPNKVEIQPQYAGNIAQSNNPPRISSINSTSVAWTIVVPVYAYYAVIEWN